MITKILLAFTLMGALAVRAQTPDLEQMSSMLKAMQQTITNLQAEITTLKAQQATLKAEQVTNAATVQSGKAVEFTVPTIQTPEGESQIVPHESIRDYQEAAQRPSKMGLDPKFKG